MWLHPSDEVITPVSGLPTKFIDLTTCRALGFMPSRTPPEVTYFAPMDSWTRPIITIHYLFYVVSRQETC